MEIREAASWGILDGVTTNPSLVSKEKGRTFDDILKEIVTITSGPRIGGSGRRGVR